MYNKADWIKAHGEEGWEEEQKRRSLFYKNRYKRKSEQIKERQKKYYAENKSTIRAKCKEKYWSDEEFRKKNNDACRKYFREHAKERKVYREQNKEHIAAYAKQYRRENIQYFRDYDAKRINTKKGRAKNILGMYRKSDLDRNRGECALSQRWILENIFASSCVYCGDSDWKHLGADRIDNSKPHTPDNCVCSCGICNVERQIKSMSVSEFVEYRKNHPRSIDLKPEVVDVDGIKVLRKKVRD